MTLKKDKRLDTADKTAIFFYLFFFVGVLGFALSATRAAMLAMVKYVLLACAVLLFVNIYRGLKRQDMPKFIGWCVFVFLATVFLEALGVNYGLVFGAYIYSDVLGLKVFGVPLIIGINWLTVILGSISLLNAITHRTFLFVLGVGGCAFLFDYLLEPAAIYLGFWQWEGAIPVQNYAAWFIIAAICAAIFKHTKLSFNGRVARSLLAAQTLFFIGIRLLMRFSLNGDNLLRLF
ncbi:MAG: carotenoid biosynthesis protein [Candidatus Omnitrophica bacterium]|nr:carotenoid biosynthesis protein [Candidatus Omnitrophota bacterium]